ncbi:Rrp15p, putative [Trypanosoma equiperdum]|uniref:Rrp15p n=3 Tax=Trypanozoon TaxID=39700 RepID=Q57Z08_TRYB2|nr:hypothetical protein, conserved [Trypanosoma brucei brucei TREU927]AAX70757.1 hypothetical protein, conserved [Trypanosoma brucei]AAX80590.1 hypothetical protein, conserved [Trypanosoma brucei]AAZ11552.1 hypothetical protein, conserved [Trypanosoma brucei brucei TREU927]SCU70512.1 Rrp15p, putative [Trypanosoma equiperdum]
MAGRFRGAVGKVSKPKKNRASKKAKGKRTVALVKRAPKLSEEALVQRVAELTGAASSSLTAADQGTVAANLKPNKPKAPSCSPSLRAQTLKKPIGKGAIEIVGKTTEKVVPTTEVSGGRTSTEAMGLKLLRRAVKNQNHNRLLPHQSAHDYEYRLRSVATAGVVCLFNSLSQSRKAGKDVEEGERHTTAEKAQEKKQMASKEAFLAALRQPKKVDRYW